MERLLVESGLANKCFGHVSRHASLEGALIPMPGSSPISSNLRVTFPVPELDTVHFHSNRIPMEKNEDFRIDSKVFCVKAHSLKLALCQSRRGYTRLS